METNGHLEGNETANRSTSPPKNISSLPAELLANVFRSLLSSSSSQIDGSGVLLDPPITLPAEAELVRRSLTAACLVNKAFHEQAKSFLWTDVSVASGRGWMSVVNTLMEEVRESREDQGLPAGVETRSALVDEGEPQRGRDLGPLAENNVQPSFAPDELTFSTARPPDPLVYHEDEDEEHVPPVVETPDAAMDPRPQTAALLVEPQISAPLAYSLPGFAPRRWQAKSYLPTVRTPPQSRPHSPVRLRSRSSRSRSRSRSFNDTGPAPSIIAARPSVERKSSLRGSVTISSLTQGDRISRSRSRAREEPYVEPISSRLSSGFQDLFTAKPGDKVVSNDRSARPSLFGPGDISPHQVSQSGSPADRSTSPPLRGRSVTRSASRQREERGEMQWTFDESALWEQEDIETPGRFIQSLSFSNFRTTGTYRTLEEAVRGKFVTSGRVEGVLKNTPDLRAIAFTEYVDSSLNLKVLTELFFRGYGKPSNPLNSTALSLVPSRVDGSRLPEYVPYEPESQEEEWDRRNRSAKLEALDFTGCVSSTFGESLEKFIAAWLDEPEEGYEGVKRMMEGDVNVSVASSSIVRRRSVAVRRVDGTLSPADWVQPQFIGLRRLSLRGCVTLSSHNIASLVSCLPCLTHLDLSFTRACPITLANLADFPEMRLKSLSLARSSRLTSEAIRDLLVDAPAAAELEELNLFGDQTYSSPLTPEDLHEIVTRAPCFTGRRLRYLDLSSCPVTTSLLSLDTFPPQPMLRSFGLCYIPDLRLEPLALFLSSLAPNVEILALTSSATRTDLPINLSAINTTLALHSKLINPLAMPPFSVYGNPPGAATATRLRVIELSAGVRRALGPSGGSQNWRVIRSKGGRGWYCDVSAGWWTNNVPATGCSLPTFRRGIPKEDPWCRFLSLLVAADGKVASNIGWHSRKMEILTGAGMLGREEGLYGAGAFAFEG